MTEFYGDKNLLIRSLKLTKVAPFFVRACFKILNAAHFSRHVLSGFGRRRVRTCV